MAVRAGIKHLVFAMSSAAFLLFGKALFYAQVGSMEFTQLRACMEAEPFTLRAIFPDLRHSRLRLAEGLFWSGSVLP